MAEAGFEWLDVRHPSAVISDSVGFGSGVQVMAGVVVQACAHIGENTIINTRASVDHDCEIGAHCHIAPGVTLSGGVRVGSGSHIGTGAAVIQNVVVGEGGVIGAGAVVTRDVPPRATVYPARGLVREHGN